MIHDSDIARLTAVLKVPGIKYRNFRNEPVRVSAVAVPAAADRGSPGDSPHPGGSPGATLSTIMQDAGTARAAPVPDDATEPAWIDPAWHDAPPRARQAFAGLASGMGGHLPMHSEGVFGSAPAGFGSFPLSSAPASPVPPAPAAARGGQHGYPLLDAFSAAPEQRFGPGGPAPTAFGPLPGQMGERPTRAASPWPLLAGTEPPPIGAPGHAPQMAPDALSIPSAAIPPSWARRQRQEVASPPPSGAMPAAQVALPLADLLHLISASSSASPAPLDPTRSVFRSGLES